MDDALKRALALLVFTQTPFGRVRSHAIDVLADLFVARLEQLAVMVKEMAELSGRTMPHSLDVSRSLSEYSITVEQLEKLLVTAAVKTGVSSVAVQSVSAEQKVYKKALAPALPAIPDLVEVAALASVVAAEKEQKIADIDRRPVPSRRPHSIPFLRIDMVNSDQDSLPMTHTVHDIMNCGENDQEPVPATDQLLKSALGKLDNSQIVYPPRPLIPETILRRTLISHEAITPASHTSLYHEVSTEEQTLAEMAHFVNYRQLHSGPSAHMPLDRRLLAVKISAVQDDHGAIK